MSGMGIYGLSGSGIDVDSMVRMGMMTYEHDFRSIEYPEFIENVQNYLCQGKFRPFVG
jgi:flagellar hook-associated protein 2